MCVNEHATEREPFDSNQPSNIPPARGLISRSVSGLMVLAVRAYQLLVSPLLGRNCRFYPSCSQYCILALQKYGPLVGVWKTATRILRCHPWHPGGFDPP